MPPIFIETTNQLGNVRAADWNALLPDDNPFLKHEFLSGLETFSCVTDRTGWHVNHILAKNKNGQLIGAMPVYLKNNSFGEFVFDWSWASAYENTGLRYYPKLVSAVPYTPVTGPRLLISGQANQNEVADKLIHYLKQYIEDNDLSGFHCLFPPCDKVEAFTRHELLKRSGWQYHWQNQGYEDFEHYLSFFRSRKRKNTRRERRKIEDSGIHIRALHGGELDESQWETVYGYYQSTFLRKGNYPALTLDFFKHLSRVMPGHLVIVLAEHKSRPIAAAINFRDDKRLYGRYWGSEVRFQNLHFEVCFYAGIEYCIKNKLQVFEPGAQGEHKITRGFLPVETCSMHWIADIRFRAGIAEFLQREHQAMTRYRVELDKLSPFRERENE